MSIYYCFKFKDTTQSVKIKKVNATVNVEIYMNFKTKSKHSETDQQRK